MSPRPDLGPKSLLGYTANPLDRAAERRTDETFLAAAEADGSARAYVVGGELVALKKNSNGLDPLFTPHEARVLAASADARHRFCANCGEPTAVTQAGWRRDCPACKAQHFPRTDPVVIMLASHGERCLLGRSYRFIAKSWSCLAGFVETGETIEQAVRRETLEEAGIACGRVTYLQSQPWPFPMSLMIGCHAQALNTEIVVDRSELEDARWFEREEVALMLLRRHPDGLLTPPPVAIAHHIIRAWVEDGEPRQG